MRFTSVLGLAVITILYFNDIPEIDGQRSLYTQKELQAIRKFRPMVSKHLAEDFMKRDGYLLRFIRSYDFDLDKAARRLEYSANYRKEKKIDGILDEDFLAHAKHLPFHIGELDKEGHPFVYLPCGKWDFRKYILAGKRDVLLRASQQIFERFFQQIWKVVDRTGNDVDQYHLIVDFDGFTAKQNLCLGCVPYIMETTAALDAITPVFSKKFTIVNAPRSFTPILNLVKSTYPFPQLVSSESLTTMLTFGKRNCLRTFHQISSSKSTVELGKSPMCLRKDLFWADSIILALNNLNTFEF